MAKPTDAGPSPETVTAHAAVETHGTHADHESHGGGPLSVEWPMFFWFLAVFLIAGWILKKFAWQPILDGLEKRENDIRASIENAERVRQELAELDERRRVSLAEADAKAKEILDAARKAAVEAARVIEHKARDEANILLDNARREVKTATESARAVLRREASEVAVGLAGKILRDQLDADRARALNERLLQEL
jgi:F-type H+-transporting ATPase subunit b